MTLNASYPTHENASNLAPLSTNNKNNSKDNQEQAQQQKSDTEKNSEALPKSKQEKTEEEQADEQRLRQIPDDPGGLLRRKFLRDHERMQGR